MNTQERLIRLRGSRTQGQVAEYSGVGQTRISDWEKGKLPQAPFPG